MASRIARAYLRSIGLGINRPHTRVELGNFAAGSGTGRYPMPYHIVRFRAETGDSKTTVGWAATLADAKQQLERCKDAHRTDDVLPRYGYYIRNIQTGEISR